VVKVTAKDQSGVGTCPICSAPPIRVWSRIKFFQRTECKCGRITGWVRYKRGSVACATDDETAG
jgi:hypothetical protein